CPLGRDIRLRVVGVVEPRLVQLVRRVYAVANAANVSYKIGIRFLSGVPYMRVQDQHSECSFDVYGSGYHSWCTLSSGSSGYTMLHTTAQEIVRGFGFTQARAE